MKNATFTVFTGEDTGGFFCFRMGVKTCYNKACSNQGKFEEEENGPEACRFHAGGPVFHDAYKVLLFLYMENDTIYFYLYKGSIVKAIIWRAFFALLNRVKIDWKHKN